MAFCKYCGRQLQEGEVCTCPQSDEAAQAAAAPQAESVSQAAPASQAESAPQATSASQSESASQAAPAVAQSEPVSQVTSASQSESAPQAAPAFQSEPAPQEAPASQAGGAVVPALDMEKLARVARETGKSFLEVFTKPATAGKEFVTRADMAVSVCMIVVQALLTAFYSLFVIGTINEVLENSPIFGSYRFSGTKAFFLSFIYSLICSAVLVLLFCLASMILKTKPLWRQLVALVAVRSAAVAPVILVSWILYLLSPIWGLAVFLFVSTLLAICFLQETIRGIGGFSGNRALYTVFIVMIIFLLFCVTLFNLSGGLYLPYDPRDSMRGLMEAIEKLL